MPGRNLWSEEDLTQLLELRSTGLSWERIAEYFPGRTVAACRLKSNKMFGPRSSHRVEAWTPIEEAFLIRHKDAETRKWIAERLGRTESSVQTKLRQMGFTRKGPGLWTREEKNLLLYWWGEEPPEKTAKRINRTINACQKQLYKLLGRTGHLTGWTTLNALVEWHGRCSETYLRAIKELGLKTKTHHTAGGRTWHLISDEQVDAILEHLGRPALFLTQAGAPAQRWARDFDCCINCGTNGTEYQERHGGQGLCVSCHQKWRRGTLKVEGLPPFQSLRKRWSVKYEACTACETTARPHAGNGVCDACKRRVKQGRLEPLLAFFRKSKI